MDAIAACMGSSSRAPEVRGPTARGTRSSRLAKQRLRAHAKAIRRADFDVTAGTFTDQAAAAAAYALRRLTGSFELPDTDTLIRDHGVAPRYRLWLERMLPEVARVGMGAEPVSSHAISGVDRLGFGKESLDFLDKVIERLPDLLTERQHSSSIYLDSKTPDVYARLFATPNGVIGALLRDAAGGTISVGPGSGRRSSPRRCRRTSRCCRPTASPIISPTLTSISCARRWPGSPERPWLSFGTFDLDKPASPQQQPARHDVIVASSAVHVAQDVAAALASLRACLKPGGLLILLEETRFFPWFDLGMGLQSGFDARSDLALRPHHPLLSRAGWTKALQAAGFGAAQPLVVPGSIEDLMGFDVILAQSGSASPVDAALEERLQAHLRERLPAHMVPTTITPIVRIPLSANGKVDRRALVAPTANLDPKAAAASDRLTQEIGALVAEVMQLAHVDSNRSLFELGATSLTLVSLQRLIGTRLGRTIALQRIFEQPTVAGFASEIASRRSVTSAMVSFAASGGASDDRPKLVLMPGVFSLPFYLRELAQVTAGNLDIVSVQLPGLGEGEQAIDSVAGQADYVVEQMRLAGMRPPFLIGGHSFGGAIAIEVARRLRLAGDDVPLLVLGDTVRTFADFSDLQTDTMAYTAMTRGLYALYGGATTLPYEALEGATPEEKFRRAARQMQEQGLFGALDLPLDRMAAVFKANFRSMGGYRPGPIPGDLALIRTEGGFPAEFLDYESGEALADPALGWTGLVQGDITVRTMPGDHLAMLGPTSLPIMAGLLVELVRDALASHLFARHGVRADKSASPVEINREILRRRPKAP